MKILVLTPPNTGSTLLVNIIHGFFDPSSAVVASGNINVLDNRTILKSHNMKLLEERNFKKDIFYIIAERPQRNRSIPKHLQQVKLLDNVLVFDYVSDLLYKSKYSDVNTKTLTDVIEGVAKKIKTHMPISSYQVRDAINRVEAMNEKYETMKNLPFSEVDKFYHIHGKHRRNNKI